MFKIHIKKNPHNTIWAVLLRINTDLRIAFVMIISVDPDHS